MHNKISTIIPLILISTSCFAQNTVAAAPPSSSTNPGVAATAILPATPIVPATSIVPTDSSKPKVDPTTKRTSISPTKPTPKPNTPKPAQLASVSATSISVASPAKPRFILAEPSNNGSLSHFESKGDEKARSFAQMYGSPAQAMPSSAANPGQMPLLAPSIASLRARGVTEGKIAIELNRLTPLQFSHWAQQVSR